jgi:lycopene beta-cyclase
LAYQLCRQPALKDKRILLLEKETKNSNDRTWSFWEKEDGPFQAILTAQWRHTWVHHGSTSLKLKLAPYTYKTIRSADFYAYTQEAIEKQVSIRKEEIAHIHPDGGVETRDGHYQGKYVFSSIYRKPEVHQNLWLWQHFLGYVIRTPHAAFDPECLTFMDFRVPQLEGACFMYILPFAKDHALVEYTAFSPTIWDKELYQGPLEAYIHEHFGADYLIEEEEMGAIPMTNYPFPVNEGKVWYIGTAGGASKPSTGYTFSRVQNHMKQIATALAAGNPPPSSPAYASARFNGYDSAMLSMLKEGKYSGSKFFFDLFLHNPAHQVLAFLDQSTSFAEELKIMSTTPIFTMAKHSFKQFKTFRK